MSVPSILVVDNEKGMREFLSIALERQGYRVTALGNGQQALSAMGTGHFNLVITDIKMAGLDGIQLLRGIKKSFPDIPVILITAYASPGTAIEAMKLGAYDYISKPFKTSQLITLVKRALEDREEISPKNLAREVIIGDEPYLIVGDSRPMLEICKTIGKVADSKTTVLIRGESGTGKELVARAIHQYSERRGAPFVVVNCGALSEELMVSELFGHVKGSFTGAVSDKPGLLEIASGGTFFFDEIGDTPLAVQVKLLRILQEQEFRRVGGTKDIRVDIRIIAATNQDLEGKISRGVFREDLLYRLNVIAITIPPLRNRKEDIPLLVDYFLRRYRRHSPQAPGRISQKALSLLVDYFWPGNVRELENVIERAIVLEPGEVITDRSLPDHVLEGETKPASFFPPVKIPAEGLNLNDTLQDLERHYLVQALSMTDGVGIRAAQMLGISPRALRYLLNKHGLSLRRIRHDLSADRQSLSLPFVDADEEDTTPDRNSL